MLMRRQLVVCMFIVYGKMIAPKFHRKCASVEAHNIFNIENKNIRLKNLLISQVSHELKS